MRRTLALLVLIAAFSAAVTTPSAHTYPVERSAVLQVHTAHADLLLVYVEPPGPRTQRLLGLYDQNGNGQIDGLEERLARRAFLGRAFNGLSITFDADSAAKTPEIRYKRDKDGGLSVAILQRIDLVIPANSLEVSVALEAGEAMPPIRMIVEPADNWKLRDREASEAEFRVDAGKRTVVALERSPAKPAEQTTGWRPNLPEPD